METKKQTQEKWVINRLLTTGECSRNGALQNYISRLGAIICNLNKSGWEIKGDYRKTEHGKDFIYYLVKAPHKPQITYKEVAGQRIAVLI